MKTASKLSMTLLPKFPGLKLEDIFIEAETVSLRIASSISSATCPVCGRESGGLHSHYLRTVSDLPWGGRSVRLSPKVRRFRCPEPSCPRRIFAERLPSVVEPYARKTTRLREVLLLVGFALGGEAGARLAKRLSMRASPSTLLRSLHSAALLSYPPPEVVGVDDFALLKGRKYGTIVVDFETHRPIELLEDRSAEVLAAWLKKHPKLRIIGRDRSTEYERGIEEVAPGSARGEHERRVEAPTTPLLALWLSARRPQALARQLARDSPIVQHVWLGRGPPRTDVR